MNSFFHKIAGTRDYHGSEEASLRRLRSIIEEAFESYGYSAVEPPILEAASLFLDRSGEQIRRRMYVFNDPGGREFCLRPELTIPTCRLYLRKIKRSAHESRLSYVGPVFRYESPKEGRYRQFYQAGVECIGATQRELADAEVLALAIDTVRRAGLRDIQVKVSDLNLIQAFISGLSISERWKKRLYNSIWHLSTFRNLLQKASNERSAFNNSFTSNQQQHYEFLKILTSLGADQSRLVVQEILSLTDVRHIGERSTDEIASRLLDRADELNAELLSDELVVLIEKLLSIHGPPEQCLSAVEDYASAASVYNMGPVLEQCYERIRFFDAFESCSESVTMDLSLHRGIDYYTSFIFEIHTPDLGDISQICGGGRYDQLIKLLGAPEDVPAVGFAIGLERLQIALNKQNGSSLENLKRLDAFVVAAGKVDKRDCIRVAMALRRGGWSVYMDVSGRRPKSIIALAQKYGVPRYIVFVGEEEIRRSEVRVKDLPRYHEEIVSVSGLTSFVARKQAKNVEELDLLCQQGS